MDTTTNVLRTEQFEIENPQVVINTRSSQVLVKESTDGMSRVEITGSSDSAARFAQEALIEQSGHKLLIRLEKNKGGIRDLIGGKASGISVTAWLPTSATIEINAVSADVDIDQVVRSLDVKTVSSDVTIHRNPTSECAVKTVSGDVVAMTQTSCKYDLKSVSGDFKVYVVPGLEIEVDGNSVSGQLSSEIALGGVAVGQLDAIGSVTIDAKTVSGDFTLARS